MKPTRKNEANILWERMAEFAQRAFALGAAGDPNVKSNTPERQEAAARFGEALEELRLEFYRYTGCVPVMIDKERYSREVQLPH